MKHKIKSILLLWIVSVSIAFGDHPIPEASKERWDYRGASPALNTWPRQVMAPLYKCKTYEELSAALVKVIKVLEADADCAAPFYTASDCRLALIRSYYLSGRLKTADRLLARHASVFRKADGTLDLGDQSLSPLPEERKTPGKMTK